jgi:hypothetical protein
MTYGLNIVPRPVLTPFFALDGIFSPGYASSKGGVVLMTDGTITEQEIQEFIRRAENAHFQSGRLVFEGYSVNTHILFTAGTDKAAKAREMILTIRKANKDK